MTDTTDEKEVVEVNYLELSDEDMAEIELPFDKAEPTLTDNLDNNTEKGGSNELNKHNEKSVENENTGEEAEENADQDSGTEDNSRNISEGEEEENTSSNNAPNSVGDEAKKGIDPSASSTESGQNVNEINANESDKKLKSKKEVNSKTEYEQVMAPFQANGKQMEVKSIKEARRLMQMGVNYNSKMASLKPNLKIIKMLENNDILDVDKLSFLIDLSKKDPKAITQLIKDSGINPLDVDVEKDSGYESKAYTVSDNEVNLDQVLQDVKSTETGKRTIDIISNKWDEASKEILVNDPNIISIINMQIGNGVYDQIMDRIDHAKIMGEYTGMTDIDAYKQMGNFMQTNRLFKGMEQLKTTPTTENIKVVPDTLVIPNAKADDLQLKNRKKAASATKGSSNKNTLSGENILNMSDDEFSKLAAPS